MTRFFELFKPPEGYAGSFGWMCGFTAHADVMGEIADRFTQGAGSFVATHRRDALWLITDPASPQITQVEAPAVHHMTLGKSWEDGFRGRGIFHAKVALLHFIEEAPEAPADRRHIVRLVVATGNWTWETLKSNIDLFWRTEIEVGRTTTCPKALADILAAYQMFNDLRPHLTPNPWAGNPSDGVGETPYADLDRILQGQPTPAEQPRFFHSLHRPLRESLLSRFPARAADPMLVIGSGFYAGGVPAPDGTSRRGDAKSFLCALAEDLTGESGVAQIHVVLNPRACQGLANAARDLKEAGWRFFKPRPHESDKGQERKLHAKFIYRGSQTRLEGELYIGSGNLTPRGLGPKNGIGRWNFEAGVVIPVDQDGVPDTHLPFASSLEVDPFYDELQAGGDFEMTIEFSGLCPLTHFTLCEKGNDLWLEPRPSFVHTTLLDTSHSGKDWTRLTARIDLERDALPPNLVRVRWPAADNRHQSVTLPVLTQSGHLVVPLLHRQRLEDVLDALLLMGKTGRAAEPEDTQQEEEDEERAIAKGARTASGTASYAARRLMAVITTLGEVQAEWPVDQTRRWANQLIDHAQSIARAEPEILCHLQTIRLNPFRHLGCPEFMPLGVPNAAAKLLKAAHVAAAKAWNVDSFDGFDEETQP
jgi:hypothetical protein